MSALTRDLLLAGPRRTQAVPVPELGGTVHVRALNVGEQLALEAGVRAAGEDLQRITVVQLVAYACDESGAPLFTDADSQDLLKLDAAIAQRIISAAASVHALDKAAIEEARGN